MITPWNFPAMIPSEYIAYVIVQGNTVVWIPAPTAAVTAVTLMKMFQEAGLPDGVVNLVIGPGEEVGDEPVVSDRNRAVAMTGSTATHRFYAPDLPLAARRLR